MSYYKTSNIFLDIWVQPQHKLKLTRMHIKGSGLFVEIISTWTPVLDVSAFWWVMTGQLLVFPFLPITFSGLGFCFCCWDVKIGITCYGHIIHRVWPYKFFIALHYSKHAWPCLGHMWVCDLWFDIYFFYFIFFRDVITRRSSSIF